MEVCQIDGSDCELATGIVFNSEIMLNIHLQVSPDPDEPHAAGSVSLVRDGCRNRDFASIIPHQPARYRDRANEVFLDFEAFLLSSMKERSTLWIHSQVSVY